MCLDGTLPGYHLDRGFGSAANNWLIQLEVSLLVTFYKFKCFIMQFV